MLPGEGESNRDNDNSLTITIINLRNYDSAWSIDTYIFDCILIGILMFAHRYFVSEIRSL